MVVRCRRHFLRIVLSTCAVTGSWLSAAPFVLGAPDTAKKPSAGDKGKKNGGPVREPDDLPKTEAEWKKALTPEQFKVLRKKQTERAFSGKYLNSKKHGVYRCAGCGQSVFDSETKFNSGTGWPSFWQPVDEKNVIRQPDTSELPVRTEVVCSRCQGHLGHVFGDGPQPTGLRYCLNSAALKLEESAAPPKAKPKTTPKTKANEK